MNPDADDVSGLQVANVQRLEGLIGDARLAICGRCRCCQHEQPARRDDADPEGQMAGIDQMDGHIARFVIARYPAPRPHAHERIEAKKLVLRPDGTTSSVCIRSTRDVANGHESVAPYPRATF